MRRGRGFRWGPAPFACGGQGARPRSATFRPLGARLPVPRRYAGARYPRLRSSAGEGTPVGSCPMLA